MEICTNSCASRRAQLSHLATQQLHRLREGACERYPGRHRAVWEDVCRSSCLRPFAICQMRLKMLEAGGRGRLSEDESHPGPLPGTGSPPSRTTTFLGVVCHMKWGSLLVLVQGCIIDNKKFKAAQLRSASLIASRCLERSKFGVQYSSISVALHQIRQDGAQTQAS